MLCTAYEVERWSLGGGGLCSVHPYDDLAAWGRRRMKSRWDSGQRQPKARKAIQYASTRLAPIDLSGDGGQGDTQTKILSRVSSVRDFTVACLTCRTWRDAVEYDLYKITCPFPRTNWQAYERNVTSFLKQTTQLCEISVIGGEVYSSSLQRWLWHTKTALKSFTFLSSTYRRVNVLKKLASFDTIKHFEWGRARIPSENLTSNLLPSLVLLTLRGMQLHIGNFQLLFSSYLLKLQSVSLINFCLTKNRVDDVAPSRVVVDLPSSLKTLSMKNVLFPVGDALDPVDPTLVLHAINLSHLSLMDLVIKSVEV
ncbi:hypothetical protein L7F22_004834 [Adiantum nelumboides]|nr:hypothetical protein [Adiantum nelumboides]